MGDQTLGFVVIGIVQYLGILNSDATSVLTGKNCFMTMQESCKGGCDWEEAGEVCMFLNGSLATVDKDETMFEVETCRDFYWENN